MSRELQHHAASVMDRPVMTGTSTALSVYLNLLRLAAHEGASGSAQKGNLRETGRIPHQVQMM